MPPRIIAELTYGITVITQQCGRCGWTTATRVPGHAAVELTP